MCLELHKQHNAKKKKQNIEKTIYIYKRTVLAMAGKCESITGRKARQIVAKKTLSKIRERTVGG